MWWNKKKIYKSFNEIGDAIRKVIKRNGFELVNPEDWEEQAEANFKFQGPSFIGGDPLPDRPDLIWCEFAISSSGEIICGTGALPEEAHENCVKNVKEKSFNVFKIPAALGLVHSEVSEATEAFRESDRENFEEELVDVILRILNIARGLDIDVDHQIEKKIEMVKTREHRHGDKRL